VWWKNCTLLLAVLVGASKCVQCVFAKIKKCAVGKNKTSSGRLVYLSIRCTVFVPLSVNVCFAVVIMQCRFTLAANVKAFKMRQQ